MKSVVWDEIVRKMFYGLFAAMLAGCASDVGQNVQVSDRQMAKYGKLTSEEALAELKEHVTEARREGMQFLAPNYYDGASVILGNVTRALIEIPQSQVISDIAKADAILEKGRKAMAVVKKSLAKELELKTQMDKDRVGKIYPEAYDKLIGELSKLIEKVELQASGNLDSERASLVKRMDELDVQAIQYMALHLSDEMNFSTRNMNGEKSAPTTLAQAFSVYKDSERRIAENPHDMVSVQRASADAMFAARHARNVHQRVAALSEKMKESVELVVLDEERLLLKISNAMGMKDLRDLPVEKQASEIAVAAGETLHGKQQSEKVADKVGTLSQSLETRLREVNEVLAQSNERLAEKDMKLAEKETQLFEKSALIADKDALLSEKIAQIKSLGDQILQLQEENKKLLAAVPAKKSGR